MSSINLITIQTHNKTGITENIQSKTTIQSTLEKINPNKSYNKFKPKFDNPATLQCY